MIALLRALCKQSIVRFFNCRRRRWKTPQNGLYVFNYHRIGDAAGTDFDPNIYSCTAEVFEQQLVFLKANFTLISEANLLALLEDDQPLDRAYALITFDDGYIDAYQCAFPILKKHQLSAVFFVVTDFAEGKSIAWWDEIAWLIRHTKLSSIKLEHWRKKVDLSNADLKLNIRKVLKAFKEDKQLPMSDKLAQLRQLCGVKDIPEVTLFANWQQLKEMSDAGMSIGSHTIDHPILAHLSDEQQMRQLAVSKQRIAAATAHDVNLVAYPVGNSGSFNGVSETLARNVHYKAAFSFYGEANYFLSESNRFNIDRISVDGNKDEAALKAQIMALSSNT